MFILHDFNIRLLLISAFTYAGVMGYGTAEATSLGFVCLVVPRVLLANRVFFFFFFFLTCFHFTPPPPPSILSIDATDNAQAVILSADKKMSKSCVSFCDLEVLTTAVGGGELRSSHALNRLTSK